MEKAEKFFVRCRRTSF